MTIHLSDKETDLLLNMLFVGNTILSKGAKGKQTDAYNKLLLQIVTACISAKRVGDEPISEKDVGQMLDILMTQTFDSTYEYELDMLPERLADMMADYNFPDKNTKKGSDVHFAARTAYLKEITERGAAAIRIDVIDLEKKMKGILTELREVAKTMPTFEEFAKKHGFNITDNKK